MVGGLSVVKILVADDNSNIQKMVGLALKDHGIDVVAVGNGEAAVRKISDLRPDLVLADVFMPVRNGYEVCQYVKMDASLAHIPVILLVGAFDPLDEQEAQRVGADGVLKKPFVPPDPLISMVKSALLRAGAAHGSASAAKTPEPAALKASDLLRPSGLAVPTLAGIPVPTGPPEPAMAEFEQESFVDEVPGRPEPVRIDSGSQTVAFGSLLETPADEKEEDVDFLPPALPELATERDWRDPNLETDEETEEEKPAAPWRPEASGSYADAGSTSGAKDWRSGSFEQILARKAQGVSWEPADEKPELVETAPAASSLVTEAPSVPASIPEATALMGPISTTPLAADAWAAVSSPSSPEKSSTETAATAEEVARVNNHEQSSTEAVDASAPEATPVEPEKKAPKESWFSVPSNPWNTEMEKANRLASAWDAAVPVAALPASGNGTEKATEAVSDPTQKVIAEADLPAAAVEAIREEAVQVTEGATLTAEEQACSESFYARHEAAEAEAATSKSSLDDLVAKVLARMSPEVLQAGSAEKLETLLRG